MKKFLGKVSPMNALEELEVRANMGIDPG